MLADDDIAEMVRAHDRLEMWVRFVAQRELRNVAELGVYQGEFAEAMLEGCPQIASYYMIDPWRHLADWNKPANTDDDRFEEFYRQSMDRTQRWESKRIVLRGRTIDVAQEIPDDGLDFAYIDADHTLRGISLDLILTWPKVKPGGFIAGDDFCPSIWQHPRDFEPTLVYPFAVYFAEAMRVAIVALPHNQFLMQKASSGFAFVDPTGSYPNPTLRDALAYQDPPPVETAGRPEARTKRGLRLLSRRAPS